MPGLVIHTRDQTQSSGQFLQLVSRADNRWTENTVSLVEDLGQLLSTAFPTLGGCPLSPTLCR